MTHVTSATCFSSPLQRPPAVSVHTLCEQQCLSCLCQQTENKKADRQKRILWKKKKKKPIMIKHVCAVLILIPKIIRRRLQPVKRWKESFANPVGSSQKTHLVKKQAQSKHLEGREEAYWQDGSRPKVTSMAALHHISGTSGGFQFASTSRSSRPILRGRQRVL